MELTLLDPPIAGYEPGDTLTGVLKYNITAQQETILDVRLHLDGNVSIHPSKVKYEVHRSNITLIEQSHTPFQGPFTLKRQSLVWPFEFTLPATSSVRDSPIPLPPSMDHHFREGLQVRVEYSITATLRLGSSHSSVKQASKFVLVRHLRDLTTLDGHSYIVSFPALEFENSALPKTLRSKIKNLSGRSKTDSDTSKQILQLEVKIPSTLSSKQQDTVTCCLKDVTETCAHFDDDLFILEIFELVLRCRLVWQDTLEDVRHIGTVINRPGIELGASGQSVGLPDTLGLQDFVKHRETPAPLPSYDSVIPKVSLGYTLTVTVILRHKSSGRCIQTKSTIPVVVVDSLTKYLFPPAYERLEATEETIPPPYENPFHR